MADIPTTRKNITTAISKLFSNSKVGEFTARNSIENALSVTDREIKATPILEPTVISNKGVSTNTIFTETGQGLNYHRYIERESMRHLRYALYERMDNDLIASALDVYANEATQKDQENHIVGVYSSSKYIQTELRELLERIGINNYKSWCIIRNMCKYGDHFEALKLDSVKGVLALKELHTNSVYRIEKDGELEGFIQDLTVLKDALKSSNATNATMNPYINLNTLALPYLTNNIGQIGKDADTSELEAFLKYEMAHFRLRGRNSYNPYGSAVIDSAIDIWKKLDLLVDSLIIYRLNKAPSRLVFYIDAGTNQGANVESIVQRQINKINKKEYFDANGKINERYNLLDMNANIYIPVQSKNSAARVDMLQGASNLDQLEDVGYLNNRLFSALKVPKAFLGFEGDVNAKGTLSQQNVTFGKAVQNIQEDFLSSIKDICLIHLAIKGISDKKELTSFELLMTRPSYVEEKARIEIDAQAVGLAASYEGLGVNKEWILKNVLRKTEAEIEEMLKPSKYPNPQAAEGGLGGLPMGGGGLPADMGAGGLEGLGGAEQLPPQEAPQQGGPAQPVGEMPQAAGNPAEQVPLQQSSVRTGDLLMEGSVISMKCQVTADHLSCAKAIVENLSKDSEGTTVLIEDIENVEFTNSDDLFND